MGRNGRKSAFDDFAAFCAHFARCRQPTCHFEGESRHKNGDDNDDIDTIENRFSILILVFIIMSITTSGIGGRISASAAAAAAATKK